MITGVQSIEVDKYFETVSNSVYTYEVKIFVQIRVSGQGEGLDDTGRVTMVSRGSGVWSLETEGHLGDRGVVRDN